MRLAADRLNDKKVSAHNERRPRRCGQADAEKEIGSAEENRSRGQFLEEFSGGRPKK